MDEVLLSVLRVAGPAVLVVCLWAVWARRVSFGSRFDAAGTVSVLLFGIGSALDAPWWATAEASYPLFGRYYGATLLADLCYVIGGGLVVQSIYVRLMPDSAIGPFLRRVLGPLVIGAGAVMVVAFAASDVPSTLTAVHPYLILPDGWMTVYWLAHFGTTTALGAIASYGAYQLRRDPRSVLINVGLGALIMAALSGGVLVGYGVITGRWETLRVVAWLLTYAAFVIAAMVMAAQWRHRVRFLSYRSVTET